MSVPSLRQHWRILIIIRSTQCIRTCSPNTHVFCYILASNFHLHKLYELVQHIQIKPFSKNTMTFPLLSHNRVLLLCTSFTFPRHCTTMTPQLEKSDAIQRLLYSGEHGLHNFYIYVYQESCIHYSWPGVFVNTTGGGGRAGLLFFFEVRRASPK